MQRTLIDPLKRILAIRLDNIGDVVMTGPALRALRQAYPGASITLMASPAGSQVTPLLPWVDEVITWRAVWQDIAKNVPVTPDREYALVDLLEQRHFDAAFIFTSFSQSPYPPAYACYLAGIPLRVGQSREFGGGLLSHWVQPPAAEIYQVERNLNLLRATGIPVESSEMQLFVSPADQRSAIHLLAEAGIPESQPYLALAPGASAAARRYDETRYAEACRKLVSETGLPIVLLGSQREAQAFPALEALAAQQAGVYSLVGKTNLPEMAGVIRRSALLIGNNSGAMHIAVALNRPMVILYSGTELLEQFASPSADGEARFRRRYLRRPTPCTPCHGFQCPYHMECLDIPVDEVVDAAVSLLKLDLSPPLAPPRSIEDTIRR